MPATFGIDHDAVNQAARELGIKRPVRALVRYMERRSGRYLWASLENHGRHHVMVASWASPIFASRVLWHELQHAAQRERYSSWDKMRDAYERQANELGIPNASHCRPDDYPQYRDIPMEREAMKAEKNHKRLPLTYPRGRRGKA